MKSFASNWQAKRLADQLADIATAFDCVFRSYLCGICSRIAVINSESIQERQVVIQNAPAGFNGLSQIQQLNEIVRFSENNACFNQAGFQVLFSALLRRETSQIVMRVFARSGFTLRGDPIFLRFDDPFRCDRLHKESHLDQQSLA